MTYRVQVVSFLVGFLCINQFASAEILSWMKGDITLPVESVEISFMGPSDTYWNVLSESQVEQSPDFVTRSNVRWFSSSIYSTLNFSKAKSCADPTRGKNVFVILKFSFKSNRPSEKWVGNDDWFYNRENGTCIESNRCKIDALNTPGLLAELDANKEFVCRPSRKRGPG